MGITTMAVNRKQRKDGKGVAEKEIVEMVFLFDNVTSVRDWPGDESETRIEFSEYFGRRPIKYLRESEYEISHIHGDNALVIEKGEL